MPRKRLPTDTMGSILSGQPASETAEQHDSLPAEQQDSDTAEQQVRLTVRIDAELMRRLRMRYAAQPATGKRRTMAQLVEEALRQWLDGGAG